MSDIQIVRVLGGGPFGRAYLVKFKADKTVTCVLKIVAPEKSKNFYKYMTREIVEGTAVKYVCIIGALSVFHTKNTHSGLVLFFW